MAPLSTRPTCIFFTVWLLNGYVERYGSGVQYLAAIPLVWPFVPIGDVHTFADDVTLFWSVKQLETPCTGAGIALDDGKQWKQLN